MHKLTRPKEPDCLSRYQHDRDKWRNVSGKHRKEIWLKIYEMQQNRCAYCEDEINTKDGNSHLEHFRQQSRYPQGTFSWSNIFGSCDRSKSCGRQKDKQAKYCHRDLIKMDEEDPENFLVFLPDGNVDPAEGLSPADENRAKETIRIFNLNGPLRQDRKKAVNGYLETAEDFVLDAIKHKKGNWEPMLKKELDDIKDLPFTTAIKHTLLLS